MNASTDLKLRVLRAAKRDAPPTRDAVRAKTLAVVAAAILFDVAVFALPMGGVHLGDPRHGVADRPLVFVIGTIAGWSVVGALATWRAFARTSMLGARAPLVGVATLTPLLLFGWIALWGVFFPQTTAWVAARPGLKCLAYTLVLAAWPLVALAYVRRERNPTTPIAAGAARGVALGALAGITVDLWCPIASPAHVLIGHIAPIVALMLFGACIGYAWNGVRARRVA